MDMTEKACELTSTVVGECRCGMRVDGGMVEGGGEGAVGLKRRGRGDRRAGVLSSSSGPTTVNARESASDPMIEPASSRVGLFVTAAAITESRSSLPRNWRACVCTANI